MYALQASGHTQDGLLYRQSDMLRDGLLYRQGGILRMVCHAGKLTCLNGLLYRQASTQNGLLYRHSGTLRMVCFV